MIAIDGARAQSQEAEHNQSWINTLRPQLREEDSTGPLALAITREIQGELKRLIMRSGRRRGRGTQERRARCFSIAHRLSGVHETVW